MQAIQFPARGQVTYTTLPDPRPGPGEVLVDMRASGICHTDVEILRGNYGSSAFPLVPGHEFAGVVAEVGPDVTDVTPGDPVVIDPNFECGSCRACARGWTHLCDDLRAYGVTVNGGFAEACVVRASAVHGAGDLPLAVAALAEPMGCVLNGVQAARAEQADSALIFGAGPIGLLMAIALRVRGVGDIHLADIDDRRLELAQSFGFAPVAARGGELDRFRQGVDLAIDATGVPAVAQDLTGYIANGGTGLFFGVCPADARIDIAPFELFRRQITLAGSHSLNHNIPEALSVIRDYGPDIARLVSHQLPLDAVARIFADGPPRGSLKIQAIAT